MKFNGAGGAGEVFPVIKGGSSQIWILGSVQDNAVLTLESGDVFVVLQATNVPAIIDFNPGTYDVSGQDFNSAPFPVVIIRMTLAESERFKTLPIELVNNLLIKLGRHLQAGHKTFPGFEQWYDLNGKRTKFKIAGFPLAQPTLLIGDEANDN